ncbi:hypothetical protein RHOFW104T7_10920 [Rhodanobacter thiooxydans]|uniref:Multi-ubiquitin domain-containing protein n=1 Tax=Rhodanobacter thiooxydans TaxID=416169 RepID=A0A154QI93_9GAMM|nr:hypothetical protein [Rhodanobacter thiooxydans]KZC24016.1 hypothetical protein RHOFW104T7_10920 [Rhodanobacter thiooxydans]
MNTAFTAVKQPPDLPSGGTLVMISLDGQDRQLQEGVYKVSDLKTVLGVPTDYELDEVIHGEFKPLNDQRSLHIKGGEMLISHVRQGSSA